MTRRAARAETALVVLNPLIAELVRSLVLIAISMALILGVYPAALDAAQASLP